MAKRSDVPEFVEELESAVEKMANWIGTHAWQVAGSLVVVLAAAWGIETWRNAGRLEEAAASNALDRTRAQYLSALGAEPGAQELPELANPNAARAIQEDYLGEFQAVAEEHPGTLAGTLALFETAEILDALGRGGETPAVWEQALSQAAGNPTLEGLLQQRIGAAHEEAEAWAEAAAAYEAAGAIEAFPLRYWALADAARCRAAAGQPDAAVALYQRIEAEAPDLRLPDHLRAQLRELRAAR